MLSFGNHMLSLTLALFESKSTFNRFCKFLTGILNVSDMRESRMGTIPRTLLILKAYCRT